MGISCHFLCDHGRLWKSCPRSQVRIEIGGRALIATRNYLLPIPETTAAEHVQEDWGDTLDQVQFIGCVSAYGNSTRQPSQAPSYSPCSVRLLMSAFVGRDVANVVALLNVGAVRAPVEQAKFAA